MVKKFVLMLSVLFLTNGVQAHAEEAKEKKEVTVNENVGEKEDQAVKDNAGAKELENEIIEESTESALVELTAMLQSEVTAAAKYKQSITDIPSPVIVISEDQIKKRGYRDLKDIFYDLPGFDVSGNVQGEVRTLVIMRGILGNQKLLVLQDGQRLNPITGERFVYGNNVPIHHAKRIEVIYGPAATIYGPDAYAGVVNIVTKSGEEINGFEINASGGLLSMHDSAWATDNSFVFGKKFKSGIDLMLSARMYQTDNGPNLADDYLELNPLNHYGDFADFEHAEPVIDYDIYGKIKIGGLTIGGRFSDATETNSPTTIPDQYLYVRENVWRQKLNHLFAQYEYKFVNFTSTTSLRYQQYQIDPMSNFSIVQSFNNDPEVLNWDGSQTNIPTAMAAEYKYALTESVRIEEQLVWTPLKNLIFTGGVLAERVFSFPKTKNLKDGRFDTEHLAVNMDEFLDPNTGLVLGISDALAWGVRPYTNLGANIQSEYIPLDSLRLSLGVRYDYNTIYGSTVNPRFGAVIKASDRISVKLMAGTAYIQPSNYYVWENWANAFAQHIPNTELDPEKIITTNLGVSYRVTDQLNVAVDMFYNRMTDVIRPVPTSYVYNPFLIISEDSAYTEINANLGVMYSYGGELKVDYVMENLHAYASYAYLDGRDEEYDAKLYKISNHKVLAGVDIELFDRITVSPRLRWFSGVVMAPSNSLYAYQVAQATANGENPDDVSTSYGDDFGQWILNLTVNGRIAKGLNVYATLNNLLNQKYYTASPYAESVWITPRAPQLLFNFMCGIRYQFGGPEENKL